MLDNELDLRFLPLFDPVPKTLDQLINKIAIYNKITSIPKWIGHMPSLEELYISNIGNPFSNPFRSIPDRIGKLHNLKVLDLS